MPTDPSRSPIRRPPPHWTPEPQPRNGVEAWSYGGLIVTAAIIRLPGGGGGTERHHLIAVFRRRARPTDHDVALALRAFDMDGATEHFDPAPPGGRAFILPLEAPDQSDAVPASLAVVS